MKHEGKARMPAKGQNTHQPGPRSKNPKPNPASQTEPNPIERSVYNRKDSLHKPQNPSPGSAASPPRTIWKPNLPAARANGFSSYR
ncbi:hypothetical protein SAMN04487926_1681 [Paraburkholderia steynii]|uniref:Uncharacterized protein n=1 Tax=Paraburkholderia steynii TaxID=1245441 RepID=A0A7Z7BMB9_9BURK|nr:hypothetical protein SAMN04487926_1681 [Paraburkholderia steynii]